MTKILCIETSTEVCSVALTENGKVTDLLEDHLGQNHAKLLTVFTGELMQRNQLSYSQLQAVAVSEGPGSYTGLRIGVSAAKGICYAANLPLIAVSPLEAMASSVVQKLKETQPNFTNDDWLCPMIDARRMEVYTALFSIDGIQQTPTEAKVIGTESFTDELALRNIWFFGNGAAKCRETLTSANARFWDETIFTSAAHMAPVAFRKFENQQLVDVAYFEPFYLKDFIAIKGKNSVLDGLIK